MSKTKEQVDSQVEEILSKPYRLDLHNDDFNSFDWVITCLMKICKHEHEQATQCAHIVHFNGVCDVKFSKVNKFIASASYDKSVRIWDFKTKSLVIALNKHTFCCYCVDFSYNGL